MTTYSELTLRRRELGSGCETYAYKAWGKPYQATLFTSNKYKWHWLNFLGLTKSHQRRVYVNYGSSAYPMWRFNVTKMQQIEYDNPQFKSIWAEVNRFGWGGNNVLEMDANEFDVLRPMVLFCQKYRIQYAVTDANWFNFLRHPRNKRVYPYDFFVPRESDLEKHFG